MRVGITQLLKFGSNCIRILRLYRVIWKELDYEELSLPW